MKDLLMRETKKTEKNADAVNNIRKKREFKVSRAFRHVNCVHFH